MSVDLMRPSSARMHARYHTHDSQQLMCSYHFVRNHFISLPLHCRSIDWVQDPAAAMTTWGDIADWDVSGVKDFKLAFCQNRNRAGDQSA